MINKPKDNWIKQAFKNATIVNVFIVGFATLIVKSLGFAKEIVIADNYGLSELLDTFYIAILIPSFIDNVFLGGYKSVFIPNYVRELKTNKNIGAFQSTSFMVTLGSAILFCLLSILATDVYLEFLFTGHEPKFYELVKTQFYYILPSILFWGLSSLLSGILNIDNEFKLSTLGYVFTPIAIMICVIFFKDELGIIVLAFGTLVGAILSFAFLFLICLRRKLIHIRKPNFKSSNTIEMFKQIPAKLSANIITGLNDMVDQYFAAKLAIGSIAALNYGIKIPMFSIGMVTIALGNVLLPYFSKKAIENMKETFQQLQKILKFIIISCSVVALILILLSPTLISIIFEHNAFTENDTKIVSRIQQMYLIQVPVYVISIILVRFLESINKNRFMVYVAIICLSLNIALNYILIKTLGVYGLALATSIVAIVNSILLFIYVKRINKKMTNI
ncbi:MAG: lipid II flippase MurJ [Flavobacteriaceae bacterium]